MTTIVGVRFQRASMLHHQDQRVYNYKTDQEVKPGDMAVVATNEGLLKIVEVVEAPSTHQFNGPLKWLIDVLEFHGEPK